VRVPAYRFPVEPADQSRYGRCHHDYPASDIFAPVGSTFVAVTDGVVTFVREHDPWDPAADDPRVRGGIAVAIVGDDGVRYYGSHLASVAPGITVGARVSAGDVLGTTGDSGNARGTPPHLHFGISPPGDGDDPEDWLVRRGTIDPWPFLEAWRVGQPLTPDITDTSGRGAC
jgi:murein DD-endopeptidase MepM/ murein hydrolase activator NlpD